ncbi:MAG: hypothetical protein JW850_20695 [Thermoflexales bacterium]|nr:hypothetical protein [Thermoflexales bacterium]
MTVQTTELRRALESLWSDVAALSHNPLIDQLGLIKDGERDDYERAMTLINAILKAGQQLKARDGNDAFALLNQAYGLEGEARRQRELNLARPGGQSDRLGLDQQDYEKHLGAAIGKLGHVLAATLDA